MKNKKLKELIQSISAKSPSLPQVDDERVQLIPDEVAKSIAGGANKGCTNSGCSC